MEMFTNLAFQTIYIVDDIKMVLSFYYNGLLNDGASTLDFKGFFYV